MIKGKKKKINKRIYKKRAIVEKKNMGEKRGKKGMKKKRRGERQGLVVIKGNKKQEKK